MLWLAGVCLRWMVGGSLIFEAVFVGLSVGLSLLDVLLTYGD